MNFKIFNTKVNILNYKFQALWFYEMDKYSFLYNLKDKNQLVKFCIEEVLMNNYLHFLKLNEGKCGKLRTY